MIEWNSISSISEVYPNFLEVCLESLPIKKMEMPRDLKAFLNTYCSWWVSKQNGKYILYIATDVYPEKLTGSQNYAIDDYEVTYEEFFIDSDKLVKIDNFVFYCCDSGDPSRGHYLWAVLNAGLEIKETAINIYKRDNILRSCIPIQRTENLIVEMPSVRALLEG